MVTYSDSRAAKRGVLDPDMDLKPLFFLVFLTAYTEDLVVHLEKDCLENGEALRQSPCICILMRFH